MTRILLSIAVVWLPVLIMLAALIDGARKPRRKRWIPPVDRVLHDEFRSRANLQKSINRAKRKEDK